jgi:hypothetical protein
MTEISRQQVDLFNAASRGTIELQSAAHQGDYSEQAFYRRISGLVKRRNAYGSGAVATKQLQHLVDTMVKVAAGTPPVALDPGQFKWIQQNPEVAGAAMGQQLAKDALADMLNLGVTACRVALNQVAAVVYNGTADTPNTLDAPKLNRGAGKFGDQYKDIAVWVTHSKAMTDYFGTAISNASQLFKYETVNVIADPFGRVFIVTDAPGLIVTGAPDTYHTLGLASGAIGLDQNNDYTENFETKNGDENILRTFQAEWSFNLGIKGFAWDKTNGGKSPNDAALAVATNWDRFATSEKDLAGVVITHR